MEKTNKRTRILNGYACVYKPDHQRTMQSDNWRGWVYLHRYLMEIELGRILTDQENVHHLDGNRNNNDIQNLIVLASRGHHIRIHNWIDNGAYIHNSYISKQTVRDRNRKIKPQCKICDKPVAELNYQYCSTECRSKAQQKTEKPSKDDLLFLIKTNNYTKVGEMFGVSDNAVRKWVKSYNVNPKTLLPLDEPTIT